MSWMGKREMSRSWFCYSPENDTWLAFLSLMAMTLIYFSNANFGYDHPVIFFVGFIFIGHILLNTFLPAYVVIFKRKEGLSGLGIGRKNLIRSLLLSGCLSVLLYPSLTATLNNFEGEPLPNVFYNAIALWEPLFVFGWLQLRFERAFGIVPAIILAALGFMTYHIGSFPLEGLISLFFSGLFFAIVFSCVRNLIILIPLTWASASTIGTIEGGFILDWMTVAIYGVVLLIQILILFIFHRKTNFAEKQISQKNQLVFYDPELV